MFFVLLNFAAAWTAPLSARSASDFVAGHATAAVTSLPAQAPAAAPLLVQQPAAMPTAVPSKTGSFAALCGLGALLGFGLRSHLSACPVAGYGPRSRYYGGYGRGMYEPYDRYGRYGRSGYGLYGTGRFVPSRYGGYTGGAYSNYDGYDRYAFSGDDRLGRYSRYGAGRFGVDRFGRGRYNDMYRAYGGYGVGADAHRGAYEGSYEGAYDASYEASMEQDAYRSDRAYREGLRDGYYDRVGPYDREYGYMDY